MMEAHYPLSKRGDNTNMNTATSPSASASTSTTMSRASEDILNQRKFLKAARLSPPKTGFNRASEDVIKQRKIVTVNKKMLGSSSPSCSSPAPRSAAQYSSTPQHYLSPTPKQFSPLSTPDRMTHSTSCSTPEQTNSTDEEIHLMTRAKLFARVDSQWVNQGTGALNICTANVKFVVGKGVLLDVDVEQMLHMTKLLKESSKGVAAHIRFHLGTEVFLIQVKPDILDKLFSTLQGNEYVK